MKANHVPLPKRLKQRIQNLELLIENSRDKMDRIHNTKGNPYWGCRGCGLADPELSIRGKHPHHCRYKSLEGEVRYYKKWLEELTK